MSKSIPNEKTWIGFIADTGDWSNIAGYTVGDKDSLEPTAAEVAAAVRLDQLVVGLNASSTGQAVPTPAFDSKFNRSVAGTSDATFSADFYRDSDVAIDDAWTALPRDQYGFFVIARFGGTGANRLPIAGDVVEVWPVVVTSRSMQQMATNTVQMFTVTCAVPEEPNEESTVAA